MRSRIRGLFDKTGIDTALIRSFPNALDPNFAYFSGLSQKHFDSNLMLLEKDQKPAVFCSPLEFANAKSQKQVRPVLLRTRKAFEPVARRKIRNRTVGINFDYYPHSSMLALRKLKPKKIVNIQPALGQLRAEKAPDELRKIRFAARTSERILDSVPDFVKAGMTEKQVADELEWRARKTGIEELAYPSIVAFGKNAAVPHHITGQTRIKKGNFLLIDFGVRSENYCSDLTRTFFAGRATEEARWKYWVVWESQQLAFAQLREGTAARSPFKASDEFLFSAFGRHLPHALGHGLGIETHDYPSRLGPEEKWRLSPNQVLTLEPGVYIPRKLGIRIEDDVVVTRTGAKWLSRAPAELIEL